MQIEDNKANNILTTASFKTMGGENNIFQHQDSTYTLFNSNEYLEVYGTKLGLMVRYEWFFEVSREKVLEGFVKDEVTTGTVSSDEELTVGFHSPEKEQAVQVYPNPFADQLTINISNNIFVESIRLVNIHGKNLIYRQGPADIKNLRVDEIRPGVYFLHVKTGTECYTRKLFKGY
jgi:hypothetical protein